MIPRTGAGNVRPPASVAIVPWWASSAAIRVKIARLLASSAGNRRK
jgi:hypothetical protein